MIQKACHKEGLFIQSNGDVYPCCGVWMKKDLRIGNVLDEDLEFKIEIFDATCKCEIYELTSNNNKMTQYKAINIETSYACQATCAMCCVDAPNSDGYYKKENYSAILNLLHKTKPENIVLQGGEILIQEETMDWISKIKKEIPESQLTLISNGNNLSNLDYAIKTFDSIFVSWVGFTANTYKTLMGLNIERTFKFCEEIINSKSTNLYLKYLLSPLNIHELPLFIEWAMKINPKGIIIHDSGTNQYINYKTFDNYWNKIIERTKKELIKSIKNNKNVNQHFNFTKVDLGGYNVAKLLQIDNKFLTDNKIADMLTISAGLSASMNQRFSNDDYIKLRNTKRYEEISVRFIDCDIKAPDAESLLFLNNELFGLEIYKFDCEKVSPVIIDCGANIGLSTIYFKKLYPNAKIIAFESDKKIFDYLKFNISSFGFDNVELINKGLWKEEAILKFFSEGADGGRIADKNSNENIVEIETVALSHYLKNEIQIDFLKLVIGGAETEVLLECELYLSKVKNIFIGYHSFSTQKQTLSTILHILENNGFRYYIEHIGVKSKHPFVSINDYVGFDNQLNIFGYKV